MATTTEYVEEYYEPNELIVDRTISPEDHIKVRSNFSLSLSLI